MVIMSVTMPYTWANDQHVVSLSYGVSTGSGGNKFFAATFKFAENAYNNNCNMNNNVMNCIPN